jgi:hypothetical protein
MKNSYFNHKIITAGVLLLSSVLFAGCIEKPLSPVAPSSDVPLSAPIIDKTVLLGDFNKGPNIQINSNGTFSYVNTYIGQKKTVDTITATPQKDSSDNALGRFYVNGFPGTLGDYGISNFNINPGTVGFFPSTSFQIDSMYIDSKVNGATVFDYIAIDTCSFTLTVTNNLPIPIDFTAPITMRNRGSSTGLTSFTIPGVLTQGSTVTVMSTPIRTQIMYSNITIDPIQIHTSGSGTPVTFTSSQSISLAYRPTSSIYADSAISIIPYQEYPSESVKTFVLDDSVTIQHATFKSGVLAFDLENRIDLATRVHFEIQEIFNSQSQAMVVFDTTFTGLGSRRGYIPIKDYFIQTSGQITMGTHLHYSIGVTFISSGSAKKKISKFDLVRATIVPQGKLVAQSVLGNFPTQYLTIDSRTQANYNLGNIDKATAIMRFKDMKVSVRLPMSGGGTPVDYHNLTVTAMNSKNHDFMTMLVNDGRLDPPPSIPVIDFTQAVNFENFANYLVRDFPNLPDSFYVRGALVINPDFASHPTEAYTIQDTSNIRPYIDMNIPSIMSITNGHILQTQDIKGKIPKEFTRAVKDGMMNFSFTNGIPLEMASDIHFLGENETTGRRDTLISFNSLGPIDAAHLGTDSLADNPVVSPVKISLTGDQIEKLAQADSLVIRFDLETGNNGAIVKLRTTDAIRIQVSASARYIINKP